jgi:hypothetical protein
MPLLNDFKLGADPEFAIIAEDGHAVSFRGRVPPYSPWGLDHGSFVIEPHPKPSSSVKELIKNLKISINDFAMAAPEGNKWNATPYINTMERPLMLGGHVHIDQPGYKANQLPAMDFFANYLEQLDILPKAACVGRRNGGYGRNSDVRLEHGHFEYRTLPSWLFSQRVAKLCLTGTKLAYCAPDTVVESLGTLATASNLRLKRFFEIFKNKDADADWLLNSGMFDKKLSVRSDRDLRDVWKVTPKYEDPHWKAEATPTGGGLAINPEAPISPHVIDYTGYWIATRGPETDLSLEDIRILNLQLRVIRQGGVRYPVAYPLTETTVSVLGPSGGNHFPLATSTWTVVQRRRVYTFFVLRGQRRTSEAIRILCDWIAQGGLHNNIVCTNGLLFRFVIAHEEARDDDF